MVHVVRRRPSIKMGFGLFPAWETGCPTLMNGTGCLARMVKSRRQSDTRGQDDDPLTKAMAPPSNETEAERESRISAEKEAQRRSDAIDEELNRQRIMEKKTNCVRVLLLDFQLFHSSKNTSGSRCASPHCMQVEEALLRKLTPAGSAEFEAIHLSPLTNLPYSIRAGNAPTELALNSLTPWKAAFSNIESQDIDFNDPNDPGVILHACKDDITALWHDPLIKELLDIQKIRLQDLGGFFLDQLERVTSLKYMPTDDDILRARLKTIGVSEHRFTLKAGNMMSHDWRVFDVGGARSLVLAEDPGVNRLEDSILLWKSVVSNPLLKRTEIVLFLNKIDIFKAKLAAGVLFGHYVVSYGDRPNDFESTSKYLMKKFAGILKQSSPETRTFYCHLTTVTDSQSTSRILTNVELTVPFAVKDMVLRQNLADGNLLIVGQGHVYALCNTTVVYLVSYSIDIQVLVELNEGLRSPWAANFACLDELTQVIYQGVCRFVILSTVSDQWVIHLGLAGPEGRWWRGGWTKADILQIVGSKSSDKVLEAFAEKLAETFVQGELYIGDWSTVKDAKIKVLTLGPSSKKPLHVPLVEITQAEAASHATDVFLDVSNSFTNSYRTLVTILHRQKIALQAQSRKCRLHPDQFGTSYISPPPQATSAATISRTAPVPRRSVAATVKQDAEAASSSSGDQKAQAEIKALKAELEKQKYKIVEPRAKSATAPKPLKGASLANPNKKARKYQAIEFESDDE
ncbi:G-protein alpha subunit-domain-containing protein [Lyophyllum atratum]|nr:G-protein alpha subunit-domain-containing protein [Lyophyllum atratum]